MFDFIAFIRKRWSEVSEFSGQKGTPVDELAVKPAGIIMSDFQNRLSSERMVNNLAEWQSMTDSELSRFGNKFFHPREDGAYSYGYVRIYKNEKEDILISENTAGVSDNGYRFIATDPGTISASAFKNSTDRFALYYIDIPVKAALQGDAYNIDASTITSLDNVTFDYVVATNPAPMSRGARFETNTEYYNRLRYTLHDGSMMNLRSTFAKLKEFFPIISRIFVSGAGDKYMVRDLVSGSMVNEPGFKRTFLGKIPGDNSINHFAFWGNFPPQIGSDKAAQYGPFSPHSDYDYPLTIAPSDNASFASTEDPAIGGYPLEQEASSEQYQGVYFDDFSRGMIVSTNDLFNIVDEEVGFTDVVVPNTDWIYGANGYKNGDFSQLYDNDLQATDLIKFNDNKIQLGSGAKNPISVSKDIGKRAGMKVTGSITIPVIDPSDANAYNGSVQVMVGGIVPTDGVVDAFTGVGFGVSVYQEYDGENNNANIFFAHSEKYGDASVFAYSDDSLTHNFDSTFALHSKACVFEPGQEYEFEFVINDNLMLTVLFNKVTNRTNNELLDTIKSETTKMMNVYDKQYNNINTTHYGTIMKLSLDTVALPGYTWEISNLKVFDTAKKRANAMFVFDVNKMDSPLNILFRGEGYSEIDGQRSPGYNAYIWDREKQTVASGSEALNSGGWTLLGAISNPDGAIDAISNSLTATIGSIERYAVDSRFGKSIIVMVTTSGGTYPKIAYDGEIGDDIHSELNIDYVAVESANSNMYHSKNMADVYVVTEKNSEIFETNAVTISKSNGQTFFVLNSDNMNMPVAEIVSVSLTDELTGEISQVLSNTDYKVARGGASSYNSVDEEIRIYLESDTANSIVVLYRQYKDVDKIQEFYSDSQYSKVFGDVLVKHKIPLHLSLSISYSGTGTEQQVSNEVKLWLDENIDGTFSVREMAARLYASGFVSGLQQPIPVSYQGVDDEFNPVYGMFTDEFKARDVEFFKLLSLSVQKV